MGILNFWINNFLETDSLIKINIKKAMMLQPLNGHFQIEG